jgi:hypothetical protein
MDERHDRLRKLSGNQDGQFATAQARNLGLSAEHLRSLRERGEIAVLRRGVWRFCAAVCDPDPPVTAYLACWPHGVISHASAARHHGLRRVARPPHPTVTVPYGAPCSPSGVQVHRSRLLPNADILRVGEVRYTTLARTVCDLADPCDPWGSLSILDDAVAIGARPGWIHQRATVLASGRSGVTLIRAATAPGASNVFRSWLERASSTVYRAASLPDPDWNVRVHDDAGLIGLVDALWRVWNVISEKEGLRFHTTPAQRRSDAKRFNRLRDAGYDPRRFTWEDVVHTPVDVAATVLRALNAAGADLDPACLPRHIAIPTHPFQ